MSKASLFLFLSLNLLAASASASLSTTSLLVTEIERARDQIEENDYSFSADIGFGSLSGGEIDSPLKETQKKIDIFNDNDGSAKPLLPNEAGSGRSLKYSAPQVIGVSTALVLLVDDAEGSEGKLDTLSTYIGYRRQFFDVALVVDRIVDTTGSASKDMDVMRVVANYSVHRLTLGALLQDASVASVSANPLSTASWLVSAKYRLAGTDVKAQLGATEGALKQVPHVVRQWSFGVDHQLDGQTKLYAVYRAQPDIAIADEGNLFTVGFKHEF